MCDPITLMVVGTTLAAGAQVAGAASSYQQGVATKNYYDAQADQLEEEGQQALKRADSQITQVQDTARMEGKDLAESQALHNSSLRAQLVAQGLTGVTAEDIALDNLSKEQLDVLVLRNNADKKSWEISAEAKNINWLKKSEAENSRYAGRQAKKSGEQQAFTSLLSSAGTVAMGAGKAGFGGGNPQSSATAIKNTGYYPGRM